MTDVALLEDGGDIDTDGEDVEPVELLVQLAEEGEIDPWDIDIVRVTDRFLDALDEGDLRASGRALFYASVLLRMKSDELLSVDQDRDERDLVEPDLRWDDQLPPTEEMAGGDPIHALESEMDRRLDRKKARGTPETLDELIRELREAERGSWWKRHRSYDTENSPRGFSRGVQTLDYRTGDEMRREGEPGESEVTGTTHQEDIDALIEAVRAALEEHYAAGRAEVLFEEIDTAAGSRIETFLALLFLSHRGEVRLQQDELFGDLWIQDPSGPGAMEGAVADGGAEGGAPAEQDRG
ncbi:MAG: segregation/condensation protein A [Halodesulfurarchaeum sp.]